MDRQENVTILEKPRLRHPTMVCGISGWVDGGKSATGSVEYLLGKMKARKFAEIPIDKFHIFQVPGQLSLRPQVKIEDGMLKRHSFPQNQFFYWANPNNDNDLILFLGTEPNLNWIEYADGVAQYQEFNRDATMLTAVKQKARFQDTLQKYDSEYKKIEDFVNVNYGF